MKFHSFDKSFKRMLKSQTKVQVLNLTTVLIYFYVI